MIWYLLIGYVVVAELTAFGAVAVLLANEGICPPFDAMLNHTPRWKQCVMLLMLAVAAPFIFPFLCRAFFKEWQQCKEEEKYWEQVRHEFKPLSLENLHSANVDQELREYFDEQSECLVALGCEHLGEVWIKDSEPQMSKGSFWLSADNRYVAEIMQVFGTRSVEMLTFFEDGTLLVTANCKSAPNFSKMSKHGIFVSCHPGLEMDQLIPLHEAEVETLCETRKVAVRPVHVEDWKNYVRYETRFYAQVMNKIDPKTEVPDEVVFPHAVSESEKASSNPSTAI